MTDSFTITLLLPEIALLAMACWLYIGGTVARGRDVWPLFAAGAFLVAAAALGAQGTWYRGAFFAGDAMLPSGPLVADFFAYAARWAALVVGFLLTITFARAGGERLTAEFFGSLILMFLGLMFVSAAMDIVLLFVALEMISIPTYILLFLGRVDRNSPEATVKYFFLSILSSALLLYGLSLLYGMGGSTHVAEIAAAVQSQAGQNSGTFTLAPVALVLIVAGLGFKITAVPFHFYAPDVYQGTTNANAGLLAVVPKIAGIIVLARLVAVGMPGTERLGWQLIAVMAMLTMTLGNVTALWQNNIRRMLAYSSIAHGGYMLIGLAVALAAAESGGSGSEGLTAMLFYVAIYSLATLGSFSALAYLSRRDREINEIDELAGLSRSRPMVAAVLGVFMFSLTGLPPLAGFWGKLALFGGALTAAGEAQGTATAGWFIALAVVGVVNAAISAAYYLRVVGAMYFRSEITPARPQGSRGALVSALACAVMVVAVGFLPRLLLTGAQSAGRSAVVTPSIYQAQAAAKAGGGVNTSTAIRPASKLERRSSSFERRTSSRVQH